MLSHTFAMNDLRHKIPNIKKLAAQLECDYSHLHAVLRGGTLPSVTFAQRIQEATEDAIHWTEFFEVHEESEP